MTLFDGRPLAEDETPDIHGNYKRPSKPHPAVIELEMETGDSMCKHEWMWHGKANKFCIYCHRKIKVTRL